MDFIPIAFLWFISAVEWVLDRIRHNLSLDNAFSFMNFMTPQSFSNLIQTGFLSKVVLFHNPVDDKKKKFQRFY